MSDTELLRRAVQWAATEYSQTAEDAVVGFRAPDLLGVLAKIFEISREEAFDLAERFGAADLVDQDTAAALRGLRAPERVETRVRMPEAVYRCPECRVNLYRFDHAAGCSRDGTANRGAGQ